MNIIYNAKNVILKKLKKNARLTPSEEKDLQNLPETYLICYLNDFKNAKEKLLDAKPYLKQVNGIVYKAYKESIRILRKVRYN